MKRLLTSLLTLALAASLTVPALAAGFSDVPDSHYAASAIADCAAKGIVSGYDDGTFRPSAAVTRAQFAVMLSRAFFQKNVDALAPQAGGKAWYWASLKALDGLGLLQGTSFSVESQWPSTAGTSISRCDMAQIMSNIMGASGKGVSVSKTAAARAGITDWSQIPSGYQTAVASVYALGIIGGYSDGSFGGEKTMNRAQGCAVIGRLSAALDGTGLETPAQPEAPETPPAETEDKPAAVTVTSATTNNGDTAWKITDNGYGDGKLNNGNPITESNVLAMLADAKKIWPNGLTWADMGAVANNNSYNHGGTDKAIAARCIRSHRTNEAFACGGFAAMLSGYVFGASSNPVRKLDDNTQVRPGDIVFRINPDGSVAHVNIAVSTVVYDGTMPCVYTANGNTGGVVDWRSAATDGKAGSDRIDDYQRAAGMSTCIIYTRYPA